VRLFVKWSHDSELRPAHFFPQTALRFSSDRDTSGLWKIFGKAVQMWYHDGSQSPPSVMEKNLPGALILDRAIV
jgi:hypothetical protein